MLKIKQLTQINRIIKFMISFERVHPLFGSNCAFSFKRYLILLRISKLILSLIHSIEKFFIGASLISFRQLFNAFCFSIVLVITGDF
jgi:hypothetical protein